MINLGGAKKLKYLHKNTDISTLYAPELQQRGVELMLFMDYTNPSALRYLVFDKEFRLVCQYHAVSVRPPEPSDSDDSSQADENESRPDREIDEVGTSPTSAGRQQQILRGQGMDIEGLEAGTITELNRPIEVKNIDNIIVVPRTNQVVIVDLANGVFLVNLDPRAAVNPAVLQPFWELDQFEKLKFRCACLCFDKNRVPLLCMFTLRQTHQHLQFRYLTKVGPKAEYGCEITESKVKAKKIFFNPLWNAFMILDFDESYYLMEFYNLNYYEKFYIRFKAIDDNQLYTEEETEFDERQPISFHSTPESEAKLFESINGRPTDHPLLQADLDVQAYHRSNGF